MERIHTLLKELVHFSNPLMEATQDKESFYNFCQFFGFDLDDDILTLIFEDFKKNIINLTSLFDNLENDYNPQIRDFLSLISSILQGIEIIAGNRFLKTVIDNDDDFILEVLDFLFYQYLSTRIYLAESALSALGVITHELIETNAPKSRQVDFVRIRFRWSRLADFIQDNKKWAFDVYGWSGNSNNEDEQYFDFVKAIRNSISIIHASGLSLAYLREISDTNEINFFLKNVPQEEQLYEAILPFYQNDVNSFDDEKNQPIFYNEAGLKLVPFGNLENPEKLGLALAPYTKGNFASTQQLSERLTLDIQMTGQVDGGAYLTLTPDGIGLAGEESVNAKFNFSTTYANDNQSPILLAGETQSTHIQADAIQGAIRGDMSGGFYLAGSFKNLKVVIDIKEDGFLDALQSRPIELHAADVIMKWQHGQGVYFEGGTSLELNVPLNLNTGAISIRQMRIVLHMETSVSVLAMASIEAQIGPIVATPVNVGTHLTISPVSSGAGLLGKYDLVFGFKPPTGIGLTVSAEGITGGGFLKSDPPNYAGAMQLFFENEIALSAFGLITTKLPDGQDGFSLVIQILAEFQPVQLGLGFALTGVGGLIGINRQLHESNMRQAIKNHTLDLFPKNPIRDAVQLIGTIQAILPPKEGFHVFGPMAKLFWGGSTQLVEFEGGIFIQIGGPLKIAIMGRAWSILPSKEIPLLVINVDVFGLLDLGEQRLAIDASLFDSKLLKYTLSGEMALRANWATGEENFALSVGGFHPRFQAIPPGFPKLRRLMVSIGSGNPRLSLSMYLAITTNTLQVGAQLDLWAKKAGFTITGGAGFDALFTFSPFSFLVLIKMWVSIKRSFVDLTVSLELELSGPNPIIVVGYAKFKVGWFTKKIRFRKEFGKKIPEPLPIVSPLTALIAELHNPRNIRFQLPPWASANLIFAPGTDSKIDPLAEIVISQNAVPLELKLDRFGGGIPPAAEQHLQVSAGLGDEQETPVKTMFAGSQFKTWSEEQRLSAKPFEKFKSGIRLGGDFIIPEEYAETRALEFETVLRESKTYLESLAENNTTKFQVRFTCVWRPAVQEAVLVNNWSMFGAMAYFTPSTTKVDQNNANYVQVLEPTFIITGDEFEQGQPLRTTPQDSTIGDITFAEAMDMAVQAKGTRSIRHQINVASMVLNE